MSVHIGAYMHSPCLCMSMQAACLPGKGFILSGGTTRTCYPQAGRWLRALNSNLGQIPALWPVLPAKGVTFDVSCGRNATEMEEQV